MIITCPRCLTKFSLPDENLSPGVELNLRCSRCREEFRFSPQADNSAVEDAADPLATVGEELSADPADSAEVDQSEPSITAVDPAPELDFDDDFDDDFAAIAENDPVASDPETTAAEAEMDVKELFSEPGAAAGEPEVGEDAAAATASEETIFELSDDFDDDEVDFDVVDGAAGADTAAAAAEGNEDIDDAAVEELALNIDDIDLGNIEFDSLDDESVAGTAESGAGRSVKPTQIDDDDNFSGLLDPGTTADVVVAEPAVSLVSTGEKVVEKKAKPVSGGGLKRTLIMVIACFLVLSLGLWGGYGLWQRFSVNMAKHLQLQEITNQRLRLPSDRVVIVLRGKLVNTSPKMVTNLKIKGVLLDKKGRAVAEEVTSGGVSFSEAELDLLDGKKLAMLENSAVNLPPNGGELPFMIAFYDYPASASDCYVELSSFKVKKGRVR